MKELELRAFVRLKGADTDRTVRLPNLKEARLQRVGAELEAGDGLRFRLILDNGAGRTCSDWAPLFD